MSQYAIVTGDSSALFEPASVIARLQSEDTSSTASPDFKRYKETLKWGKQRLYDKFADGASAQELVQAHAQLTDLLLATSWSAILGDHAQAASIVAVGGYGRAELLPHSDIDLLILIPPKPERPLEQCLEQYLAFLWDIGLEVGHSVRSLDDCAEQAKDDITVMTNMLESRVLAGDLRLYAALRDKISPENIWPVKAFFDEKLSEQHSRHNKHHDTAYRLEPNVKESPGGLRDIHTIQWVAQRHFGTEGLSALCNEGFLTSAELAELQTGQAFLWRVRYALHMITGRCEDRLLFDHQVKVADYLGYRDASNNLAVEQFMQLYWRTIKALSCLSDLLLQLFKDAILYAEDQTPPTPINEFFQIRNGAIEAKSEDIFQKNPSALLKIFQTAEDHGDVTNFAAQTIRWIRRDRKLIDEEFRQNPENRQVFLSFFRKGTGLTHILRRMNRYGVLGRYLPAFGNIIGRMQYDLFHTLTVDEHTLFVVRNMRRLTVPQFAHEHPRLSKLLHELPKPELLYLSGLFHDIAKGRDGDHSKLGVYDALEFCRDHGMSPEDGETVAWLVKNHLLMSMTAQRNDITDPDVVKKFAEEVVSVDQLNYLYLLTVCDIRATNPNLWNSWRAHLLGELHATTRRYLQDDNAQNIGSEQAHSNRLDAAEILESNGLPHEAMTQVWAHFDDEYFRQYDASEIAWHTQALANRPEQHQSLVLAKNLRDKGSVVFIYTPNQDFLFGKITAELSQLGLTILNAQIYSSTNQYTLDTYNVVEADGSTNISPERLREVRETLERALSSEQEIRQVTRRMSRALKHFQTETTVSFEHEDDRTTMELTTGDQPGLLSIVGRIFADQGIVVHAARIGTIGERVEDTFLISGKDSDSSLTSQQEDALRAALSAVLDNEQAA